MLKFLKTLLRPDREESNPESAEIAQAANLLQIGEFQLLQLAYKSWYGEELPEAQTDRLFSDYMLRGHVPHWARHYARCIVDWNRRGLLDGDKSEYHRYDRGYSATAPGGMRRFVFASAMVIVFVGGALWVSHLTAESRAASYLPPYFDEDELNPSP